MLQLFNDLNKMFQEWEVIPQFKNLEELKDKGEYIEEEEKSGDLVTKRVKFKSADGKIEIYKSITTNKNAARIGELADLKARKELAIEHEDFNEAAKLRDQIKQLEAVL